MRRAVDERPRFTVPPECSAALISATQVPLDPVPTAKQLDQASRAYKAAAARDQTGKSTCRLAVALSATSGGTEIVDIAPVPVSGQASRALRALNAYSLALVAIVDAGDRQSFREAAAAACGSVSSLTTAAAQIERSTNTGAQAATTVGSAVCTAATTVIGISLDHARYSALRGVVLGVDNNVSLLARYIAREVASISQLVLMTDLNRVNAAIGETNAALENRKGDRKAYREAANVAISRMGALQARLDANPVDPFMKMAAAHNTLAAALRDQSEQIQPVIESMLAFLESAVAAREAVRALGKDS